MTSQNLWDDLWGSPEPEIPMKSFNSIKMAQYFQERLFDASWSTGFASVDIRALSSQLVKWRNNGATAEDVTAMIDLYMSDNTMRGKVPGWKDFLYRREQLSEHLKKSVPSASVEEGFDEDQAMKDYLARRNRRC